jgi:holo-[acyl-carrier-protein] synthase
MKNTNLGNIGIDIVDVSRCKALLIKSKQHLLEKFFTVTELSNCVSYINKAEHLAGVLALKEASSKALGAYEYPFIQLEVRHRKDGKPEVWFKNKKVITRASISHTSKVAVAVAIV